jgi:Family of unknown function (DUF6231)
LEYLDTERVSNLVARLRDLHSKVLYIVVVIGDRWPGQISHWNNEELIALWDCDLSGRIRSKANRCVLYHYDIHGYKWTPDWLSSKYWVNPHRGAQERW